MNDLWQPPLELWASVSVRCKQYPAGGYSSASGFAAMHPGRTTGKGPSTHTQIDQQPPRLLIVHIALPSWGDICANLCEALQNFFSLACSLMGPSRVSLFSLYMVQDQHECILPFVQVKGNFPRLQTCISELRMLQREGCFRSQGASLRLAVEDGLQQFKQYSTHVTTRAALTYTSLEITILTSQPGKEVVKQLEEGLKDTDLARVRRLQVVEVTKGILEHVDSVSPVEDPSNDEKEEKGHSKRRPRDMKSKMCPLEMPMIPYTRACQAEVGVRVKGRQGLDENDHLCHAKTFVFHSKAVEMYENILVTKSSRDL
ncbi:hypothetical protein H8959_013595 [Pygathrix nigripes]